MSENKYFAFARNGLEGDLPSETGWTAFRSAANTNAAVTLVGTFDDLPAALEGLGEVASTADVEVYFPVQLNGESIHRHGVLKSGPYVVVGSLPSKGLFDVSDGPSYKPSGAAVEFIDAGDLNLAGESPVALLDSGTAASKLGTYPTITVTNAGDSASESPASVAVSGSLLALLLSQQGDDAVRKELSEQIIRAATGTVLEPPTEPRATPTIQQSRWMQEKAEREQQQTATASLNREMVKVLQRWGELSTTAVRFLIATTIFAAVGVAAALALAGLGKLNGSEVALITFVLAVFAASPAALLLLERPLKGVDTYAGGGKS